MKIEIIKTDSPYWVVELVNKEERIALRSYKERHDAIRFANELAILLETAWEVI